MFEQCGRVALYIIVVSIGNSVAWKSIRIMTKNEGFSWKKEFAWNYIEIEKCLANAQQQHENVHNA